MLVTDSYTLILSSQICYDIFSNATKNTIVSGGSAQNIHPKQRRPANLALLLGRFPEDTIEEIGRMVLAPIPSPKPRDPGTLSLEELKSLLKNLLMSLLN